VAKQRQFMGAELARARSGEETQTGMSEAKLSEFASKSVDNVLSKAMGMIDAYLFKHGHILPCGHHAEEGGDIDKACSMSGCSAVGGTAGVFTGYSGPSFQAPTSDGSGRTVDTGASEAAYWAGHPEG